MTENETQLSSIRQRTNTAIEDVKASVAKAVSFAPGFLKPSEENSASKDKTEPEKQDAKPTKPKDKDSMSLDALTDNMNHFKKRHGELINKLTKLRRDLQSTHAAQDAAVVEASKLRKEIKFLSDMLKKAPIAPTALENTDSNGLLEDPSETATDDAFPSSVPVPLVKADTPTRKEKTAHGLTAEERREYFMQLESCHSQLKENSEGIAPMTNSWMMYILLGNMNLVMFKQGEKLKFKSEYERMKVWHSLISTMLALVCVLLPSAFLDKFYMIVQLVGYFAINLREEVLKANGSNIKPWWTVHHHLTALVCIVFVSWPFASPHYQLFRSFSFYFAIYLGFIQMLQYRYQMARLYTLRCLNKAHFMDVVNSDSSPAYWSPSMLFLLPFLIFAHLVQAFFGYNLLQSASFGEYDVQTILVGIISLIVGVGNFIQTLFAMYEKHPLSTRHRSSTEDDLFRNTLNM
eukprot:GCRY01003747.1.p1 GENE.GCRY01003747.1~~GCRY01003747.1.p1  ORF type:complete len:462 (+),score=62.27 GCRY01003747.1:256-1641(+)